MIALVVAAPYVAGAVVGATAGLVGAGVYGGLSGAIIYGAIQAGVLVAGGMLINSLLPQNTPDFNNPSFGQDFTNSSTYSWGIAPNSIQEGVSLPVIYGTARITPPIISQYVETVGSKQYLNMLFALNDGEVSAITDI